MRLTSLQRSYQRSPWEKHVRCHVLVLQFLLVLAHIRHLGFDKFKALATWQP